MKIVDLVYSFLWDIFDSLLNYESIGFVLHGLFILLSDNPGLISSSGGMFDRLLPQLCKFNVLQWRINAGHLHLAQKPFLAYYGPRFLLWELSTPFLNLNWFLERTSLKGSKLHLINGISLLISFFFARLVYGSYMVRVSCMHAYSF